MSTGGLEAGGRAVPVHASAALVLIAIHAVLAVALGGDTPTRAVVSDAIFAAALVGAGSLAVAAARSSRARARRSETGWALIASGMFLRAAATVAFAFADPYRVPPGAIEAVTGGLYLVAYAPIILGMFLMPLRLLTGAERISLALDASTVTIATGIVLVAVFGFPEQSVLAVERMRGVLIVGMLALNLALIAVLSELFLLQAYRV